MADKIRILHCGENNGALSGFGKYSRELFTRLVENDRFELAELSSSATVEDPKLGNCKWKCYPVAVLSDDPRYQQFKSNPDNNNGFWRFERVCLDFKPDIVMDIRDPWNMFFEQRSPLRNFFHWVISPTVDSYPQQAEWIEYFMDADAIFTYSDFGLEVLRKQSNDRLKLQRAIYSGVDLKTYKPKNKKEIRKKYGLDEDCFIIGTVMRNQIRKLYPELFQMFRGLLDKYKDDPKVRNSYLYIHTSYPDNGWEIPRFLKDFGISNRVLVTYYCQIQKKMFVSHYEGINTYSPHSHSITGKMPSVADGLDEETLSDVFNLFDLYIQYASNEGCGIPMLEAAACGIPISGINYSSMEDNIRLTNGIPLSNILRYEVGTQAYRAQPLIDKNIEEIYEFMCLPESSKIQRGLDAREAAEKHFNWDINAKVWSDYFESVQLKDRSTTWDSSVKEINDSFPEVPKGLSNIDFVKWISANIAKRPEMASSLEGLQAIVDLNTSMKNGKRKHPDKIREILYDQFKKVADNVVAVDTARMNIDKLESQDYIEFTKDWN